MRAATSRSCTTSRRACASRSPSASPRIATSWASGSTAPSSWACRAKPPKRSSETIAFAKRINPHTIQVSLAAPYPGTFLYNQAVQNGWLDADNAELVDEHGIQIAPLHYPHLRHKEIFDSLEDFYKQFYFRPGKIASIVGRDGAFDRHDEAAPARRRGILPVPARAAPRGLIVAVHVFRHPPRMRGTHFLGSRGGAETRSGLSASTVHGDPAATFKWVARMTRAMTDFGWGETSPIATRVCAVSAAASNPCDKSLSARNAEA